jgi:hypothetical protein
VRANCSLVGRILYTPAVASSKRDEREYAESAQEVPAKQVTRKKFKKSSHFSREGKMGGWSGL